MVGVEKVAEQRPTKKCKQRESETVVSVCGKTRVRVSGGSGGKGAISMEALGRKRKFRPDGGHGGNGGSVILMAHPSEQSLKWSHPHIQAEKGANGTSQEMIGRNGRNRIIRVPCGVVVRKICVSPHPGAQDVTPSVWDEDVDSDQEQDDQEEEYSSTTSTRDDQGVEYFAIDDPMFDDAFLEDMDDENVDEGEDLNENGPSQKEYLADLDKPGAHIVVARGGKGGYGSMMYSSSHGPLPKPDILAANARPHPGEVVHLELELKLIADVGLVGFPNAGKSSLLRAMSRATPEVAPYPFTTLHPLMGVVEYRDGTQIKVADIPGLIAGASQGRGKGIAFLRHVERTKALCYILDAAGTEGRDPHEDLRVLVDELSSYAEGSLLERRALVVANKMDLIEPERLKDLIMSIEETADSLGVTRWCPVVGISAGVTGAGLETLSKDIRSIVEQFRSVQEPALRGA